MASCSLSSWTKCSPAAPEGSDSTRTIETSGMQVEETVNKFMEQETGHERARAVQRRLKYVSSDPDKLCAERSLSGRRKGGTSTPFDKQAEHS